MADISLLFEVAGGGSISGESGKRIKGQLEEIVRNIGPIGVKFEVDETSVTDIRKKLTDLSKLAESVGTIKLNSTDVANMTKSISDLTSALSSGSFTEVFRSMDSWLGNIAVDLLQLKDAVIDITKSLPQSGSAIERMAQEGSVGIDNLIVKLEELYDIVRNINSKEFTVTNTFDYKDANSAGAELKLYKAQATETLNIVKELDKAVLSISRKFPESFKHTLGATKQTSQFTELARSWRDVEYYESQIQKSKSVGSITEVIGLLEQYRSVYSTILAFAKENGAPITLPDTSQLNTAIAQIEQYHNRAEEIHNAFVSAVSSSHDANINQSPDNSKINADMSNVEETVREIGVAFDNLREKIESTFDFTTLTLDASKIDSFIKEIKTELGKLEIKVGIHPDSSGSDGTSGEKKQSSSSPKKRNKKTGDVSSNNDVGDEESTNSNQYYNRFLDTYREMHELLSKNSSFAGTTAFRELTGMLEIFEEQLYQTENGVRTLRSKIDMDDGVAAEWLDEATKNIKVFKTELEDSGHSGVSLKKVYGIIEKTNKALKNTSGGSDSTRGTISEELKKVTEAVRYFEQSEGGVSLEQAFEKFGINGTASIKKIEEGVARLKSEVSEVSEVINEESSSVTTSASKSANAKAGDLVDFVTKARNLLNSNTNAKVLIPRYDSVHKIVIDFEQALKNAGVEAGDLNKELSNIPVSGLNEAKEQMKLLAQEIASSNLSGKSKVKVPTTTVGEASKALETMQKKLQKSGAFSKLPEYEKLTSAVAALSRELADASRNATDFDQNLYGNIVTALKNARTEMAKFSTAAATADPSAITVDVDPKKLAAATKELERLARQTDKYLSQYSKARFGKSNRSFSGIDDINSRLKSYLNNGLGNMSVKEFNKLMRDAKKDIEKYRREIRGAGEDSKSFSSKIKDITKRFAEWFSITRVVTSAFNALRRMVSSVVELDKAMTDLKKVTAETQIRYDLFLKNAISRTKQLGSALTDIVQATADFAKLGYSISEAEKMADAAVIYRNVGDGTQDISEASESIIATMQAFGVEADNVMTIVDKFNEVGNNFAISSSGIGDALLRSAAAMHSAGNTIDETIALATAANTIVQNPETVGTTIKTISMYLRAAKTEAEEAGESTDGMASSVSELRKEILDLTGNRVDIMIDENTFKDTYDILKDLSEIWRTLSDTSRANILEMVGGKRNANIVSALLENFSIAEKALKTSQESAGSALRENEKILDSIQGKTSQLQAAFESLSATIVDENAIKVLLSALSTVIIGCEKIIKAFGNIYILATSITALIAVNNLDKLKSFVQYIFVSKNLLGKLGTGILSIFKSLVSPIMSTVHGVRLLINTISKSEKGIESAKAAFTKWGGISSILSGIITVITLCAAAIENYKRKAEELRAKNIENAEKASDLSDDITELYLSYATLSEKLDDTGKASEEFVSAQNAVIDKIKIQRSELEKLKNEYGDYESALNAASRSELERQKLILQGSTSSFVDEVINSVDDNKRREFIAHDENEASNNFEVYGYLYNHDNESYARLFDSFVHDGESGRINIEGLGFDLNTVEGVISAYNTLYNLMKDLDKEGYSHTGVYSAISGLYSDLGTSVEKYKDHLSDLRRVTLQIAHLEAIEKYGVPVTQEDFDEIKDYILNKIGDSTIFGSTEKRKQAFVDDYLSIQESFSDFYEPLTDTTEEEVDHLEKFRKAILLIQKAFDEQSKSGKVTSDTYNDIIALGEDYANLFSFTSGVIKMESEAVDSLVESLINEYGAKLAANSETEDSISLLAQYAEGVMSTTKEAEEASDTINSLVDILDKMKDGASYGSSELFDLINQYPELASAVIETADGYQIEQQAILDLITQKTKLIRVNNLLLSQQAKAARESLIASSRNDKTAANIDYILSKYDVSSFDEGANSYVNAWMDYFGKSSAPEKWLSGVKEYVEAAIAEKAYSKTVENILKQLETGDYLGGSDVDKKDEEKSAFETEYNRRKHLLAMEQTSVTSYLSWLSNAYKEAYKSGQIGIDDYYQYEEEVYEKSKTLRSDAFSKTLEDMKFNIEVLKHNNADDDEIISSWQKILSKINREIAYYEKIGYDSTNEILRSLVNEAWSVQEEISAAVDAVAQKAEDALSGFLSFYSTITSAAKEYASIGALSPESLQKILELEPKYLTYLTDKDGHIVLNSIQNVIAKKTEDLAITNALTFANKILIATQEGDIDTLTELTKCTASASDGTWDMVYATLNLAKATAKVSGIDESYYSLAENYIGKMKTLADTTTRTISSYYDSLKHGYMSASDGLDQILNLTQELIRWETENATKALEEEKDAYREIVDKKKEALALSREQEKHDSSTADKLKEISKLQSRIDQLALDDSREAKAQRAQLEAELAEKQKEFSDEQSEYTYEKQVAALDKQVEAFEESKDKEIETANNAIMSTEKLYQMAINRINNNWSSLYDDLLIWNEGYGSTLQSEIVSAWDAAAGAVQRYGSFVGALEGVQNDTVLGDTVSSNYASSIVDTMKKNSSMWTSATPEQQKALADKNVELAALLAKYLGRSITRGADGVWMIDGMKLYDIYHTGGIVGRNGTISQNETMALLENGEMVLDSDKQSFLMSAIGFFEELSNRIGSKIDVSKLTGLTAGSGYSSNLRTMMDELTGASNGEFNFSPEVNVYISHSGDMSESDAKRYGEAAAESVLEKLSNAFSRRGIFHTGNNLIKT